MKTLFAFGSFVAPSLLFSPLFFLLCFCFSRSSAELHGRQVSLLGAHCLHECLGHKIVSCYFELHSPVLLAGDNEPPPLPAVGVDCRRTKGRR